MNVSDACPACGETARAVVREYRSSQGQRFSYRECLVCGLQRIDPWPDAATLAAAYSERYYGGGTTKFVRVLEFLRNAFCRLRVRRVLRESGISRGHVLDIGCGNGKFLELMSQAGWEISGTEIRGTAYARAEKVAGIHLYPVEEGMRLPLADASVDVVTIWHVLEHVSDPKALLAECRRVMKEGGMLLVEVPNVGSWQARWSGRKWFHLDPPRHFYEFTDASLRRMLDQAGFTGGRAGTLSLEMGIYGFAQSLMNLIVPRRDVLYSALIRGGGERYPAYLKLLSAALFVAILVPSFALALIESCFRSGAVLRITCKPERPLSA